MKTYRMFFVHGDSIDYRADNYTLEWPRVTFFNAAGEVITMYYDSDIAAVREIDPETGLEI